METFGERGGEQLKPLAAGLRPATHLLAAYCELLAAGTRTGPQAHVTFFGAFGPWGTRKRAQQLDPARNR